MVYENVKQLCREHNITIAKMEREAGLANGTVNGWKIKNPISQESSKNINILLDEFSNDVNEFFDNLLKPLVSGSKSEMNNAD